MNSNWGLVDPLPGAPRDKQAKREALAERAQTDFLAWMGAHGLPLAEAEASAGRASSAAAS
jgi:hypothetical protein